MAHATLDGSAITDWESFHTVCAQEFGFPDFYGRNLDAWIDCMSYIDMGDGMCRFVLQPQEILTIEITASDTFRRQAPNILASLAELVEHVNDRLVERGDTQRLCLVLSPNR